MRAINRKLIRDVGHTWAQGLAIALVVAAGVAMFVGYISTFRTLRGAQRHFYEQFRFAHVFAAVKRAPLDVLDRVRAIPGVSAAEARVTIDVTLDVPGLDEPAVGRLVSTPVPRRPVLNDTYLRAGRDLSGDADEVLVTEGFARAHRLLPGAALGATINGRRRQLRIAGIALSPEFVYAVRPGEIIPDEERFAVLWMDQRQLSAAYDMTGACNQVSVTLLPDASEPETIRRLDQLLEAHGGLGAVGRQHQTSHFYINSEMDQLQAMGLVIPVIFFTVAGFVLNVALTRLVMLQREQIAALKALGYTNVQLSIHYAEWAVAIAGVGAIVGVAAGTWMGAGMTGLYNRYFRFPVLDYRLSADTALTGIAAALAFAVCGAAFALRRVVSLAPAEAMRPEAPARFRETRIERLGMKTYLSPAQRMVLRNLVRQPVRGFTTTLGVAMASALLVVGMFSLDAIRALIEVQFFWTLRQDATVTFVERTAHRAVHDLARLPGVLRAEPFVSAAVRLRHGHRSRLTNLTGLVGDPHLARLVDADEGARRVPPDGMVLSSMLARVLDVRVGDILTVDLLEGRRRTEIVRVAAIVTEYMGAAAYMHIDALQHLVGMGDTINGAFLDVDDAAAPALYVSLK